MVSDSTPDAPDAEKGAVARADTTLTSGPTVAVEVGALAPETAEEGDMLARAALGAAAVVVAEKLGSLPKIARATTQAFHGIVGTSAEMRKLSGLLDRIKGSGATILISGENGTGKELVAKAVHRMSKRADKRFVATNCSAFNDNLLESELFGHRRGSFTGAVSDKPGLFEVADGGTFFLDEVGDMSPALQVKLLRVLQEGVFMPVGATEPRKVDVRIIAATNRDLGGMVKSGAFREDLYYRLHVVAVRVPPLRERRDDIPLLCEHFMAKLSERDGTSKVLSQRALDRLMTHEWPGNVRELENEIERLWVLSGHESLIDEEHLTPVIRNGGRRVPVAAAGGSAAAQSPVPNSTLPEAVEDLERRMIIEGLRRAKGNKTRAAEELGISRRNLIRKVQGYDLEGAWNEGSRTEKGA